MTKKSLGRQERDAQAAQAANVSTYWTDLNAIYAAHRNALDNACNQVKILYGAKGLKEELLKGDPREVAVAVRGLANDYSTLLGTLNAIYAKHKDVDVDQVSDADTITAVAIGEEYEGWIANFLAAVMPNVEYLIAEINFVLNRIRRQVAANGLKIVNNELSEPTPA